VDLDLSIIQDAHEAEHSKQEKQAEHERSEVKFRMLVEAAAYIVMIVRADETIAYCSPYSQELTGHSATDVVGKSFLELFVPDSAQSAVAEAEVAVRDGREAIDGLASWLSSKYAGSRVLGVGHRVVHGGQRFAGPTLVNPQVLEQLRELVPLAPLHQPHNLAAIEAVCKRLPEVPQVACFDTSFHRGQPAVAELVPLPREIRQAGVQRYGFLRGLPPYKARSQRG